MVESLGKQDPSNAKDHSSEIVRESLLGHKGSVESLQLTTGFSIVPDGLLSASEDGTARIWDLRTNKGVVLLKPEGASTNEIQRAAFGVNCDYPIVATASGETLSFFDLRKPSLILKSTKIGLDESLKSSEFHSEDINDISIQSTTKGFKVASCDDTGLTIVQDINVLEEESGDKLLVTQKLQRCLGKHDNICYRTLFSKLNTCESWLANGSVQLYTTGFDYKVCLWNLNNTKKSKVANLQQMLINLLGEQALSYNPPFCYAVDSYVLRGQERLVMGLGNGYVVTFMREGLAIEELYPETHRAQINSICVDMPSETFFTCSNDLTFGIHAMQLESESTASKSSGKGKKQQTQKTEIKTLKETKLRVQLEEKPNEIVSSQFSSNGQVLLADVTGRISKFLVKY